MKIILIIISFILSSYSVKLCATQRDEMMAPDALNARKISFFRSENLFNPNNGKTERHSGDIISLRPINVNLFNSYITQAYTNQNEKNWLRSYNFFHLALKNNECTGFKRFYIFVNLGDIAAELKISQTEIINYYSEALKIENICKIKRASVLLKRAEVYENIGYYYESIQDLNLSDDYIDSSKKIKLNNKLLREKLNFLLPPEQEDLIYEENSVYLIPKDDTSIIPYPFTLFKKNNINHSYDIATIHFQNNRITPNKEKTIQQTLLEYHITQANLHISKNQWNEAFKYYNEVIKYFTDTLKNEELDNITIANILSQRAEIFFSLQSYKNSFLDLIESNRCLFEAISIELANKILRQKIEIKSKEKATLEIVIKQSGPVIKRKSHKNSLFNPYPAASSNNLSYNYNPLNRIEFNF